MTGVRLPAWPRAGSQEWRVEGHGVLGQGQLGSKVEVGSEHVSGLENILPLPPRRQACLTGPPPRPASCLPCTSSICKRLGQRNPAGHPPETPR